MRHRAIDIAKAVLGWWAVAGFCWPPSLLAAVPDAPQAAPVTDVALRPGGLLVGQVVDPQGRPLGNIPVALNERTRPIAQAKTDACGYFAIAGLRGGVYQAVAADTPGAYRLWTPGTAPPSAQQGALLIAGQTTVRGQCCGPCGGPCAGPISYWLSSPCVVGAIFGAAVAIPVSIHNSERPSSP